MSNWKPIIEPLVRTAKNTALLDAAQGLAASRGEDDPLPSLITKVVARIRSAISPGNALDTDATKIPNSLEALALGMIVREVKGYLEVDLSEFEKQQMRDDASWLNRMTDEKLRFEVPDTSDGNATMQAQPTPAITIKTRNFTERTMDGV